MIKRVQGEPRIRQTTQEDLKKIEEAHAQLATPLLKSSMFKKKDQVIDQRQEIPNQLDFQNKKDNE